jgi:hypothetical protein
MEDKKMNRFIISASILSLILAGVVQAEATVAEVTHRDLQAVNSDGVGTFEASDKVTITGIILNNPEEMLSPVPGVVGMGGQWQIYIQGEGEDHAGTAVFMGQNYSIAGGSGNYTDEEWLSELYRINYDPNTSYMFTAGDRVRVTGWYKFYKGKININEKHQVEQMFDFDIELIKPAVGLPKPEIITLDMVKGENDEYIFDDTRLTGCEYYQGRLVRVDNVVIIDPENWAPDGTVTIVDETGRTFPVKLGVGDGFANYSCPTEQIDVIAIFDQESSGYTVCKDGYRLWVPNYDGNGLVLTDRDYIRTNLPDDINMDSK